MVSNADNNKDEIRLYCWACDYDVTSLSAACPECGMSLHARPVSNMPGLRYRGRLRFVSVAMCVATLVSCILGFTAWVVWLDRLRVAKINASQSIDIRRLEGLRLAMINQIVEQEIRQNEVWANQAEKLTSRGR